MGGIVHVAAGAVGVSALVLASAELFAALKLAGALYLAWLGLRTILAARRGGAEAAAGLHTSAPAAGARRAFREGVLVEALNPKTAAFFLALLPQFVDPGLGHVGAQFLALGLVSVSLNTAVACAAGAVRGGLAARPRIVRRLREASGAALVALGAGLLLSAAPARVQP